MALSSCLSLESWITSMAMTPSGSASRWNGLLQTGGFMAYERTSFLAMHGYASRQETAGNPLKFGNARGKHGRIPLRILITGHRGYIGRVLVPMAVRAGHEVVGLDSGLFEKCVFGQEEGDSVPWIRKDIRNVEVSDLDDFDAVMHLAGISNDPLGDLESGLYV